MADCLCQKRSVPLEFPLDYPTLKEGEDPAKTLNQYGYFLVRNMLDKSEVEACRQAVKDICLKWYANFLKTGYEGPDWEEVANRRPAWKNGTWKPEPGHEDLGFRRLYRMTQHEDFFVRMCRHQKVYIIYTTALCIYIRHTHMNSAPLIEHT